MSFKSWWQESFPVDKKELDHAMSEPVPIHMKKWWWALGGTPLLMLIIQIITGLMLVFYYVPNPEFAYESISHITHVTPFGWLIRSIHRWASNIMIAALILHMMRVFFTGAYRAPRELNWMFGVIIFLITLGFGFTGYSLVYEQMSYWAMKVGTEIAGATPLIGGWIADFMRGGSEIGNQTLTRFFALHVILMPILMMTLLAVHIYLIRTLGISELTFKSQKNVKEKTFPFFPDHVLSEAVIAVLVLILLVSLSILFPAELGEKANPNVTPMHIKPEWYFFPVFRWLKVTNLTIGVLGPMIYLGILFFWPFIDKFFEKAMPGKDFGFWIGVLGMLTINIFLFWEIFAH